MMDTKPEQTKPTTAQSVVDFWQSVPRWAWLGSSMGLILVIVIACWGGNLLLGAATTPVAQKTALITDGYGVPMALVPVGPFQMGSKDGRENETPVHTVKLDDFYIDQYEVTNARYAECVAAGVCDPPSNSGSYTRNSYYGDSEYADYPVIYVDWNAAQTYCQWRDARLPTEAEWEKAARGGLERAQYPWGDEFNGTLANFCDTNCEQAWSSTDYDDGYADTAPVGTYPKNGNELYDMAGNVWEWTADWYDSEYYANSPKNNPGGPEDGRFRVNRGGSWDDIGSSLRVVLRIYAAPPSTSYSLGFRCARSK